MYLAYSKNYILKDIAEKINNMGAIEVDSEMNGDNTAEKAPQEELMTNLKRISKMNSQADSAISSMQTEDYHTVRQVRCSHEV